MAIRLDAHGPEFLRKMPPQLPVRCATTAAITIATDLNAGDTIDGITLVAGDRVLVKNQGAGAENGIYVAGAAPARSFDMLEGVAAYGALVYTVAGTVNGGKLFKNTNTAVPIIGSTVLTFVELPGGVTDHGALTGLADDDHPQYTTAAEAEAIADSVTAIALVVLHNIEALGDIPLGLPEL